MRMNLELTHFPNEYGHVAALVRGYNYPSRPLLFSYIFLHNSSFQKIFLQKGQNPWRKFLKFFRKMEKLKKVKMSQHFFRQDFIFTRGCSEEVVAANMVFTNPWSSSTIGSNFSEESISQSFLPWRIFAFFAFFWRNGEIPEENSSQILFLLHFAGKAHKLEAVA